MPQLKRVILAIGLTAIGIATVFLWSVADKYVVPILMYHHVRTIDKKEANTVSPEIFEKQMAYLKKNNFKVLSLDELVETIKNKKPLSPKSAVITFDDGYEDNYTYAFKALKKYQYPAIIFLISDWIDKEGYLSSREILQMNRVGISFGSHTRNHPYLPSLKNEEVLIDEIKESREFLKKRLNIPIDYFAYPSGGFNEKIKGILKMALYKAACTTNRGTDRFNHDLFELKRIRFGENDSSDFILEIKLSGYYNLFRALKSPE